MICIPTDFSWSSRSDCGIGVRDTVFLSSFRLKDLGQIKEVKKITTPTATEISARTAVSPCVGPSLQGEVQKAGCSSPGSENTHLSTHPRTCLSTHPRTHLSTRPRTRLNTRPRTRLSTPPRTCPSTSSRTRLSTHALEHTLAHTLEHALAHALEHALAHALEHASDEGAQAPLGRDVAAAGGLGHTVHWCHGGTASVK